MLTLQNITYMHPNREVLFNGLSISFKDKDKVALIGENGIGKSTLLKIMAGELTPSQGAVRTDSTPFYVPQAFGQFNSMTIGEALRVEDKLIALREILAGEANESNLSILNDDWSLEERIEEAFAYWKLSGKDINLKMESLSGGEKTKVFLAGMMIHNPEFTLMDEPTNHLDRATRDILYDYVQTCSNGLVVVSHDRTLLNLLNMVYELDKHSIKAYGGNYEFYKEQKELQQNALMQSIKNKESELRKAMLVNRETGERKQRQDARGKKKQIKSGVPTIMLNTLRNKAENSAARLKDSHAEKISEIKSEISKFRSQVSDASKMKLDFENSDLHTGRVLIEAQDINFGFGERQLWDLPLNFQVRSGDRICIKGQNGSGKTTLIKIMLGELEPAIGAIKRANSKSIYIDQDYSLINDALSVYEQAQTSNTGALQEHEIKIRLSRFLFDKESWDKSCSALSGGEKMRLALCCLMIEAQAPDLFILDEPTNNLDIQNTEILTTAINEYTGTVIVVSHDEYFLNEINVGQEIVLE